MTAKTINVAVVGAGFMGTTHLRTYLKIPGVRVVAICSPSRKIVNGILGGVAGNIQQSTDLRLPDGLRVVREFNELLRMADVDAVDICSPTNLHPSQTIAALRTGKHVLCEKPIAENSVQARAVLKVAAKSDGLFLPAMCMRFWPGWDFLKTIVDRKKYGKILAADFRRLSFRPAWGDAASHPGGALLDLHIHDTDFVHYLFGRPSAVFSTGVTARNGAIEHVVTQYVYPRGPVVSAEGSWLAAGGFNMTFTIQCERATLEYDFQRGPELRLTLSGKSPRMLEIPEGDGYNAEIRHFIDCVRKGRPSPIVSAKDAVAALEICEAEERSVRRGGLVRLA